MVAAVIGTWCLNEYQRCSLRSALCERGVNGVDDLFEIGGTAHHSGEQVEVAGVSEDGGHRSAGLGVGVLVGVVLGLKHSYLICVRLLLSWGAKIFFYL